MSYTPQAGDVIAYRGDPLCYVNVIGEAAQLSMLRICVTINGFSEWTAEYKSVLSEMVNEFGWTLVSRKEVQDGK